MDDKRFIELATKFLSREITEEEKNDFSIILQVEQYKNQFEIIVQNWNSESRSFVEFDLKEGLKKLTGELKARDNSFYWGDNVKPVKLSRWNSMLMKVAASIVLFILLSSGLVYFTGILDNKPVEITWNEQIVSAGQKSIIELPDRSKITLNGDSKLKYPTHFSGSARNVFLEGEAYFEVEHDSSKPFIVQTKNLSTVVLGTKFNVSAFNSEKEIIISLVEGKVKVNKEIDGISYELVQLRPEQQLLFNKEKEISEVENFITQEAIGWKDNILKFNSEPLEKVFIKLERAYGIKFELTEKSYSKRKITTNFQNASLWTISEVLKKLTGLKYKNIKEGNQTKKIIFYKK